MAIVYTEKGLGMHNALAAAGIPIASRNGVWVTRSGVSEDDVNSFIAAYDPLPGIKSDRVASIKLDGLPRIKAIFPAIESIDQIEFYAEFWQSIKPTSRQATVNFQKVIDIYSAAKSAIVAVNSSANAAAVAAVVVTWP